MNPKIIGIVGKKKSGKDTLFGIISAFGAPVVRLSFGDVLKKELAGLFHVSIDAINKNKDDWRALLQAWGDRRREVNGFNYWIDKVREEIKLQQEAGNIVILTDCRYANEAQLVKHMGGQLIRVVRKSTEDGDSHVTETALEQFEVDHIIENDSTVGDLKTKATELYARIFNEPIPQGQSMSGDQSGSQVSDGGGQPAPRPSKGRRDNNNK
jgi:hypothetical protein